MKLKERYRSSEWGRSAWDDRLYLFVVYASLIAVTFLCLYPIYFTVIASFSDAKAVYTGKISFLPVGFTTEAYELVISNSSIWRGYANSIFYTVAGTALNLFLTIPTAYALSKKRLIARGPLMTVFIITMYFSGGMIPTYLLLKKLELINTPWVMILSSGLSVYNVIVTRTYFENNIPDSLCEAARIDGANEFGIFGKIVIPLSKPILAVITLYYAVSHWNGYFNGMIYLSSAKLQPLQVVLRKILILNESAIEEAMKSETAQLTTDVIKRSYLAVTMKFSLVFIASLPMLIAYPFVQKHFVKGVMIGAVKG